MNGGLEIHNRKRCSHLSVHNRAVLPNTKDISERMFWLENVLVVLKIVFIPILTESLCTFFFYFRWLWRGSVVPFRCSPNVVVCICCVCSLDFTLFTINGDAIVRNCFLADFCTENLWTETLLYEMFLLLFRAFICGTEMYFASSGSVTSCV